MFHLIGDFVRLGDTTKDALHSTVVASNDVCVLSINRNGRKLTLHVWTIVRTDGPYKVMPVLSVDYASLRTDYVKWE